MVRKGALQSIANHLLLSLIFYLFFIYFLFIYFYFLFFINF